MKLSKSLTLLPILLIFSCFSEKANNSNNTNIENTSIQTSSIISDQIDNSTIAENNSIIEDKYYHAEKNEYENFKANQFNENWTKIFLMKPNSIKEYDKSQLYEDMVVYLQKDLNNDGLIETIITGTFATNSNEEGAFIALLNHKNEILILSNVSDQPVLVHMRDIGKSIFFGTGYGSEYFQQISWEDNNFKFSDIILDY